MFLIDWLVSKSWDPRPSAHRHWDWRCVQPDLALVHVQGIQMFGQQALYSLSYLPALNLLLVSCLVIAMRTGLVDKLSKCKEYPEGK